MEVFHSLESLPKYKSGNAVTIGNFDGIHRGHRRLIETAVAAARKASGQAIVMTFHPHPISVFTPEKSVKSINSATQTIHILEALGVDTLLAVPFDDQFAKQEPEEFVFGTLIPALNPACVVIGKDHRFGRARKGDSELLTRLLRTRRIEVIVMEPVFDNGDPISSSRIREYIREGNIEQVTRLLGRFFRLNGTVQRGWGRGRDLGYATANFLPTDQVIPNSGVYATRTILADEMHHSMTYIGSSPTFSDQSFMIETHLFDRSIDLLGVEIEVEFIVKVRNDHAFTSPEELIAQIAQDEMQIRRILANVS